MLARISENPAGDHDRHAVEISPGRLRSLWDIMINFNLTGLFTALDSIETHLRISAHLTSQEQFAGKPLEAEYKSVVENNLQWVAKQCRDLSLEASEDRIVRIWGLWRDITPAGLFLELKPLRESMEDDLRKLHFYRYSRDRAILYMRIPGDWAETLGAFPSARPEIEEGVDSYACERNAAAVFHMMRVAEMGLRALARERQVTFPKHPVEYAEWENIIDQMESKAREATNGMARGPQRDAARAFYTAAVAQLRAFKETRNAIMHMRGQFDKFDAERAINQVRDFMNGLSSKIGEKTRKPIAKWP